jgi:MoxR-like ATPase
MTEVSPPISAAALSNTDQLLRSLEAAGYLADRRTATTVYLANQLAKPILVAGPAGTGKTQLAKSVADIAGARLVRLQCYEGLDESKALYEWNYRKQLLRIETERATGGGESAWNRVEADIFSPEFLLERPLLAAIRSSDPVVLLIDEVDRIEVETEALLLEVLSDYQVSVPELGTIAALRVPLVFLTSNSTRELSEALKRRCLFLHLDYPSLERERAIVQAKVPDVAARLRDQLTLVVRSLRSLDLRKRPSVSETLDWAHALVLMECADLDGDIVDETLHVLLKSHGDLEKARAALSGAPGSTG